MPRRETFQVQVIVPEVRVVLGAKGAGVMVHYIEVVTTEAGQVVEQRPERFESASDLPEAGPLAAAAQALVRRWKETRYA